METNSGTGKLSTTLGHEQTSREEGGGTNNQILATDKGKELALEHFHSLGSLGNALLGGDQSIPEPVDEVADVESIAYDRKRQVVFKRTNKKRRLTLDIVVMITMEETMLDAKQSKVSELLGAGMAISNATINKAREDE